MRQTPVLIVWQRKLIVGGADYVISIHNNAGGGNGFEIYHTINGGKGKTLAADIEVEVKKIGQNSRGLKTKRGNNGDYFGMIRLTVAPAVICEGFFVDNATDVKIADTVAKQKEFGYAYARGILKTLGILDKGLNSGGDSCYMPESFLVKVTADVLNIRAGAGTNHKITGQIKDKGTYTIVQIAEGTGATMWGKLKSGAGWISLDYIKRA